MGKRSAFALNWGETGRLPVTRGNRVTCLSRARSSDDRPGRRSGLGPVDDRGVRARRGARDLDLDRGSSDANSDGDSEGICDADAEASGDGHAHAFGDAEADRECDAEALGDR